MQPPYRVRLYPGARHPRPNHRPKPHGASAPYCLELDREQSPRSEGGPLFPSLQEGVWPSEIVIRPDVSSQAPFDTYRIEQNYRYEDGLIEETVELVKLGDGPEKPWVRNTERATLYTPGRFDTAPTSARGR
jgi:hypothetical protein